MELCTRENAVFFNILTVWSLAFLAAWHTTVCLDFSAVYKYTAYIILSRTVDCSYLHTKICQNV